ncbi:YjzD family protein [Lactobacillus pasteurii]|uniref:DUF2929 family protein n=1 Tax=Lactobacillus pasteurii DSM 23907 = CRBIP 24.76 TaxID=1423790 RepID=I7JY95_9LACO|nr:YjzD family protein [Lactobacillus pasteurii]TDG76548.1 hypothetical protein C5L33_001307 [Lactobacillus pasteurii]CCI85360.1 Putative uncharacterized protein [Lactobacillus pasteurii DSM 23907 = CRBIP 24.76]
MGRYLITIFWSVIYMIVIGFIAGPLTQTTFNPIQAVIIGVVFGILFSAIIPTITANSHKDKSKYSNLK